MLSKKLMSASASAIATSTEIEFINYSYNVQLNGSTVTGSVPADAQAGDILIAFSNDTGYNFYSYMQNYPSGWTELEDANGRWVGYTTYNGSDLSWDFESVNNSADPTISIVAFRNCTYGAFSGISTTGGSSQINIPDDSSFVVAWYSTLYSKTNVGKDGPTNPSGFTTIIGVGEDTASNTIFYKDGFDSGSLTIINDNITGTNFRGAAVSLSPL